MLKHKPLSNLKQRTLGQTVLNEAQYEPETTGKLLDTSSREEIANSRSSASLRYRSLLTAQRLQMHFESLKLISTEM